MPSIRDATTDDLADVDAIYAHYVQHSPSTFDLVPPPWEARIRWFQQFAHHGPHRLMVAVGAAGVRGCAWSHQFRARPAYDATVEASVYVAPDAMGQGHGRALYAALLEELDRVGVHRIVAGITLPNPASVALHEAFGFRHVGRFTEVGFKFGEFHDVGWFERPQGG